MKNFRNPESRLLSRDRHRLPGILLGSGSNSLIISLLIIWSALSVGCGRGLDTDGDPPKVEIAPADSVPTIIKISTAADSIRRFDLFFFGTDGVEALGGHLSLNSLPDSVSLLAPDEDLYVVGVANSPFDFNLAALSKYDSMALLSYDFADDDPEFPIMAAACTTSLRCGSLVLAPLLCKVMLSSISSTLDDYDLLEASKIRLHEINNSAAVLCRSGFRPSETIEDGVWAALPFDVGLYTQDPGITLYCYPNDTPETTLGSPHTEMELQCRIRGQDCSFRTTLPPITRGSTTRVAITVGGPDDYSFDILK